MSIDIKQIQKLASLSRLEFPEDKLPAFVKEFESILAFVAKIQTLDTQGVPPLTTTADIESTPERPDVVTEQNNRDALLANAPKSEQGFIVVPKIVE